MTAIDAVALTQRLIRCPSITPREAGSFAVLEEVLKPLGFDCRRLRFGAAEGEPVDNLYARLGEGDPVLAFAGHVDVVPPGPREAWRCDPFAGERIEGSLVGRGAADMKSGVAAFVAAVGELLEGRRTFEGSIMLLITADEEGRALHGTRALLAWLAERDELPSACLVGEPTSVERVGDTVKIGRRGSLTVRLRVRGKRGHVAYPHRADNAAHGMVRILDRLISEPLDGGTPQFPPSSLQITTIDIGNPASNVIPGEAEAVCNIRFNDLHSEESLRQWVESRARAEGGSVELAFECSGEAFLTPAGPLVDTLKRAIREICGVAPRLDTGGGTSDARFIRHYCPVVEFGIVGQTMHQVNEAVNVEDIGTLTRIYRRFLELFFERS